MPDSKGYAVVPYPPPVGLRENLLLALHRALEAGLRFERRLEPFFRRGFNWAFREPVAALLQYLINRKRPNEGLGPAQERVYPDEPESLASITAAFGDYMQRAYRPGTFERGGNTKTHGIVRAEVIIRDGLPVHLRHGVFATPRSFPAFVRFSGPGPNLPPDIDDVGFGSMTMKLMDVPGPKLMEDEKFTQDFLTVSTPSFVTPNTRENAKLQWWSFRAMPVFYFLNPFDSHLLDFFMQGLWNETLYNPLATRYWSCVPYLLGEGQAMMYSFAPRSKVITRIPGVPFGRVPTNYLHDNLAATLARQDAELRSPGPGADRSASDADRECIGALAGKAVAVHSGGNGAHPEATDRHARPYGLRQSAVTQSMALSCRAPPTRQPEPRAAADVLSVVAPAPGQEPYAAYRTYGARTGRVEQMPADAVIAALPAHAAEPSQHPAGPDGRVKPRP